MVDYLDKISIYKCLVLNTLIRCGGTSTAAKALKVPVSKIHNELKAIEKSVGCPVILRDKRKILLTSVGEKVAEFARMVVESTKVLGDSPNQDDVMDINIGTNHGFAEGFFPEILEKFHLEFPNIHINLFSGAEYLDFTHQDMDIVIGPALDNRSDLTKAYIRDFSYGFYASKQYIEKKGRPKTLKELKNHQIAFFKGPTILPKEIYDSLKILIASTNYRSLLECVRRGLTIGFFCKEFLEYGFYPAEDLVNVLPDFVSSSMRIHFTNRKFTKKSIQINRLQEITLEVMRQQLNLDSSFKK